MERDVFSTFHPLINFIYFVMIIGCSMFVMHPVFLCLSILGGFSYYYYLKRNKAFKTLGKMLIPIFVLSLIVNPLFNHQGGTILFYYSTGNPFTLESLVYGGAAGLMLVSVLSWFSCYQVVMTSDKFIYLFGKVIPSMSLVLSMIFRFVPKFRIQIEKISNSQKCVGRDVTNGTVKEKAHHGMKILSVMTTWALENSVETADSMKSRGYGLRGRTNFSIYRFDTRDRCILAAMCLLGGVTLLGLFTGKISFYYYPTLVMNKNSVLAVLGYFSYGLLCIFPVTMNLIEDIKWHYLKSEI